MAKKRNCRRTPEEVSIHDEAVKLRKMTDAQLVEKVRSASAAASKMPAAHIRKRQRISLIKGIGRYYDGSRIK